MARIIKKEEKGPYKIEEDGKTFFVCGCGLSKNQPYCDGSHKITLDEEEGVTYKYDENGNREKVD